MTSPSVPPVDLGIPVIAMHSPYEVIAKTDLYEASLAFGAFCKY
jgi:aspartyl aminopeptidase